MPDLLRRAKMKPRANVNSRWVARLTVSVNPRWYRGRLFALVLLPDAFSEFFHYVVKIGISGPKAACEPVPATVGDGLAIGKDGKLSGPARRDRGLHSEPLLDELRETRGLGLIARSRGTGTYLNLHWVLHRRSRNRCRQ
jgi:hypothetical protein